MRELTMIENNIADIAWDEKHYWWLECIMMYDDDELTAEENLIQKGLELHRFIQTIAKEEDLNLSSKEVDAIAITCYNEFKQDEGDDLI